MTLMLDKKVVGVGGGRKGKSIYKRNKEKKGKNDGKARKGEKKKKVNRTA